MKITASVYLPLLPASLLVGCATMPAGPSVLVLPGMGKSFDQFRADDARCRQYAQYQIGGVTPTQVATGSGVGAAIGASTITGSESARVSGDEAQQRYDMSYIQCMYANGNKVPVHGSFIEEGPYSGQYPDSDASYPPPPGIQPPLSPR